MTSHSSLEPSSTCSWPSVSSLDSFQSNDQFMEYGTFTNNPLSFIPETAPEYVLRFSENGMMSDRSLRAEKAGTRNDAVETDIQELAELNLRTYHAVAVGRSPSTGELLEVTQSAIQVLERIAATMERQNGISVSRSSDKHPQSILHDGSQTSIRLYYKQSRFARKSTTHSSTPARYFVTSLSRKLNPEAEAAGEVTRCLKHKLS